MYLLSKMKKYKRHVGIFINIIYMKILLALFFLGVLFFASITQSQNTGKIRTQSNSPSVDPVTVDPIAADPIPVNLNTQPQIKQVTISDPPKQQTSQQGQQSQQVRTQKILNPDPKEQAKDSKQNEQNINLDLKKNQEQRQNKQKQKQKKAEDRERQRKLKEAEQRIKQKIDKEAIKSAEKSAQYKMEQQRLKELRKKQQQYQAKRNAQMGANEKVEYTKDEEQRVSETQNTRIQERKKARQIMKGGWNNKSPKYSFETVLFQISSRIQQYLLRPSSKMVMYLKVVVYVEKDGAYGFIEDIAKSKTVKAYVYEDDEKIVGQISCYFEGAIRFQVKGGSVYSVKFYNYEGPKLISFSYPSFITSQTASQFISSETGENHYNKAKQIIEGLQESMKGMQQTRFIDINNANALVKSMKKYFGYQIIQVIVIGIICYLQMYMIKRLFKNPTIL